MKGWLPRLRSLLPTMLLLAACSPAPGSEEGPGHREPGAVPLEAVAAERAEPLSPEVAAQRAWAEDVLRGLDLRQRVAQLVMPWISGAAAGADRAEMERMLAWAASDEVGGLIVSTGRPEELAGKLNAAQGRARVPLLVVSDLETGPGMRLSPGGTDFPPAMAFGAADDESLARAAGRITAVEARAVGIHMTLGPVLDVNSNPDNPIINVRSFGENPRRVASLADAWRQGAREGGLLSSGKHFPGHGDTEVDSHVGVATVTGDSARLAEVELVPFQRVVRGGIDGMLVGHIAMTGLEGSGALPASLSPRVIGGLLREQLGFEGLVFTDAMNMGAITRQFSVEEASIRALQAGADILLQPPGASGVIEAVVAAVRAGRLSAERIEESARRVLRAKAAAGLHRGVQVSLDSLAGRVGAAEHEALARRVAEASITLAQDPSRRVPLAAGGRVLHVVYTRTGDGPAGAALTRELAAGGVAVESARVGSRTRPAEYDRLRRRAEGAAVVVVSVAVSPHQYQALGVQPDLARFVDALGAAGRPVIVVSLGSPYLLGGFSSSPAYLLAWSPSAGSQRAAAHALLGTAPIRGRLPVALPPHLPLGAGEDR